MKRLCVALANIWAFWKTGAAGLFWRYVESPVAVTCSLLIALYFIFFFYVLPMIVGINRDLEFLTR